MVLFYKKEVYPELNKSDFKEHILPLNDFIEELSDPFSEFILEDSDLIEKEELYPYHNACRIIAEGVWRHTWDTKLNKYTLNPSEFKKATCEFYSQVAFSYLIRSFAKDIKLFKLSNDSNTDYDIYTKYLIENKFQDFSQTYNVVWGRCLKLLINRAKSIVKTIELINQNRNEIERIFDIPNSHKIVSINTSGDTHNNGSSVSVVNFEKELKLIYKPRPISGEVGYSKLIEKLNCLVSSKFSSLKVLDLGGFGFTSYIEKNEMNKNMKEAGRIAALMYFLNSSDMHYSNIYWTNNGPIPIDLETLFHPKRIADSNLENFNNAYYKIEKSVYGTGILPIHLTKKSSDVSVDVGFTGVRDENSNSPFKTFNIEDGFTSNIKVVWQKQIEIDNSLYNDENYEKFIYSNCKDLIEGFTEIYMIILNNKNYFINCVLETFDNSKLRYIHNMTYRYEQILRILTDSEPSKNIDLAHMLLSRIGILSMTSNKNIVSSECTQLWNGDIPYFSISFDQKAVESENKFVTWLPKSPKEEFMIKMNSISLEDLNRQIEIIKLAFVAKLADPHRDEQILESEINEDVYIDKKTIEHSISYFMNSLTERIMNDRYNHLPKTWIGPVSQYGKGWTPGVLGYDLYSGRTGPFLALLLSGKQLKNQKVIDVAYEFFDKVTKIFEEKTYDLRNLLMSGIGAFSGMSGIIWSLYTAGKITENSKWKNTALKVFDLIDEEIKKEEKGDFFDMISGSSGAIIMRYKIQEDYSLSENFIKEKVKEAYNIINNKKNLSSGLAHGISQIMYFFAIIYKKQKLVYIRRIIEDIHKIIKSNFTNVQNLIEIYRSEDKNNISSSWCNGLSGLLVSYYEGYKAGIFSKDEVIDIIKQIEIIPLSVVPILCHGSLGVYDSLKYVSKDFEKETRYLLMKLEKTTCSPAYIVNYFKEGRGRYTLSPGLMTGKTGALLHLCKLLDGEIDVSPLTFEV
ncbi:type 2 lanthipeptide synthetase LanM [Staphylococcus aureus]|uniref:type 2 lanthipeptide synthetase LanM n=1 Tax=Staphylococcus aureus TaxID=1280 RepID=UPI001F040199|nr:type 2 lanthipeptide synthetase LanM [Staphylococcus aureus]ULV94820.1 type 2 lantipeptide synthetase LanM [Staphylococcus aureus]